MPLREVSCQQGSRNAIEQYGQRFLEHYADTLGHGQIKAPPDDPDSGFEWVTPASLQDASRLYVAVLPRGHSSLTQAPIAVLLTPEMLERCAPGSRPGSMGAGFARSDVTGQLADASELGPGKELVLATFYQRCSLGGCWHPLLQFSLDPQDSKRHAACLGQLGSGREPGAVVLVNHRLNSDCKVRPPVQAWTHQI